MLYNVLIVEDDRTMAESLAAQVRVLGHTVAVALGPRIAMQQLNQVIPDLIFLDINMPGVNGLEIVRFLRRDPTTAKVPVIIVSGEEAEPTKPQPTPPLRAPARRPPQPTDLEPANSPPATLPAPDREFSCESAAPLLVETESGGQSGWSSGSALRRRCGREEGERREDAERSEAREGEDHGGDEWGLSTHPGGEEQLETAGLLLPSRPAHGHGDRAERHARFHLREAACDHDRP